MNLISNLKKNKFLKFNKANSYFINIYLALSINDYFIKMIIKFFNGYNKTI